MVEVVRSTTEEHVSSGLDWQELIDLFAEIQVSATVAAVASNYVSCYEEIPYTACAPRLQKRNFMLGFAYSLYFMDALWLSSRNSTKDGISLALPWYEHVEF